MINVVLGSKVRLDRRKLVDLSSEHPRYRIYHAFREHSNSKRFSRPLVAPPTAWMMLFKKRFAHLDEITVSSPHGETVLARAQQAYLEMLSGFVLGTVYGRAERSMKIDGSNEFESLNMSRRAVGEDMAYLGLTMIGQRRLMALHNLLVDVLKQNIPGDVIETGVWRGGASIYAAGVLSVMSPEQNERNLARRVILCDSFSGLPPGNASYHRGDVGWNKLTYLSVSASEVMQHFVDLGLLDARIIFAEGFFNHTMLPLSRQVHPKIAVLRLDGDLYESTMDVLYHLFELVSVGGYIIVDDWDTFPAKDACLDFFRVHGIQPTIVAVDRWSVYFQKTAEMVVPVQYWRYEQKAFK